MGGIIADDKGRTTIANLYAIGEVTMYRGPRS
ncbi:FAD-binding protein [Lysinibacillus fusiformis]